MTIFAPVEFAEKPPVCPFCLAAIEREWKSESGESSFITYKCGFELADQSAYRLRLWRKSYNRDCKFIYQRFLANVVPVATTLIEPLSEKPG